MDVHSPAPSPDDDVALFNTAVLSHNAGAPAAALHALGRLLGRRPDHEAALRALPIIMTTALERLKRALHDGPLEEALPLLLALDGSGLQPQLGGQFQDEAVRRLLARALEEAKAGRWERMRAAGMAALAVAPAHPDALRIAGQAERRRGAPGAACRLSARATAISPGDGPARGNLDNALLEAVQRVAEDIRAGRLTDAERLNRIVGEVAPPALRNVALGIADGIADAAQPDLATEERIARLLRTAAGAHRSVGAQRLEQHRFADAARQFERAMELHQTPETLADLGRTHRLLAHESLLDSVKYHASAFLADMTRSDDRDRANGIVEEAMRLLGTIADDADHWLRTQHWSMLNGLKAMVAYGDATGRHPQERIPETAAFPERASGRARRRVFDGFTFFNEVEILEIRLHELHEVVDRFIVVEARQTHTGKPKDLVFPQHAERFAAYRDKIDYHAVDLPAGSAWHREAHQRDCITLGLTGMADDDLVIVADVDEIPRRAAVERLRDADPAACPFFTAEMDLFLYFLNYRFGRDWCAAAAASGWLVRKVGPNMLRYLARQSVGCVVKDAGWHLSWMGGEERFLAKVAAYAHQEHAETFGAADGNRDRLARFLSDGGAAPDCGPGIGRTYETLAVGPDFPTLVRQRQDGYHALGWIKDA